MTADTTHPLPQPGLEGFRLRTVVRRRGRWPAPHPGLSPVTVVVPSAAGPTEADGAFDLFGAGVGRDGSWPAPARRGMARPPSRRRPPSSSTSPIRPALALLGLHAPECAGPRDLHLRPATKARSPRCDSQTLRQGGEPDFIGLHVPINPLAATHRHNGLGFTGYLLVLSDRVGAPDVDLRPPMVAWLTARFPTMEVVVIEDATAAVWRGRVLRGVDPGLHPDRPVATVGTRPCDHRPGARPHHRPRVHRVTPVRDAHHRSRSRVPHSRMPTPEEA